MEGGRVFTRTAPAKEFFEICRRLGSTEVASLRLSNLIRSKGGGHTKNHSNQSKNRVENYQVCNERIFSPNEG